MRKKGELLVSNIVFIVLNLAFLAILILFIAKQGGGAIVMEQSYAKQIALLIDASQPGMQINLRMDDAIKKATEERLNYKEDMVTVSGNVVKVRLTQEGGYSYSFFNDVDVTRYFEKNELILKVNKNE